MGRVLLQLLVTALVLFLATARLGARIECEISQLTQGANEGQPSLSREGRWIAFAGWGDLNLYSFDARGTHPLSAGPGKLGNPTVNRNARVVTVESNFNPGLQELVGGQEIFAVRWRLERYAATCRPD